MVSDMFSYLVVLKIYLDYKRSGLDSFEIFEAHIENGSSVDTSKSKSISYSFFESEQSKYNDEPSLEFIDALIEKKDFDQNQDYWSIYENHVETGIHQLLFQSELELPSIFELSDIFTIINENDELSAYFKLDKNLFDSWFELAKGKSNKTILSSLNKLELRTIQNTDVKQKINSLFGRDLNKLEVLFNYFHKNELINNSVSKTVFYNKFMLPLDINSHKINLEGNTINNLAHLINELKPFFIEKYSSNSTYYNSFWANGFTFKGREKDANGVSKIISRTVTKEQNPTNKKSVQDLIFELKNNHAS